MNTRYTYREEPLTEREAIAEQLREICSLRERARELRKEADELEGRADELLLAPAPTTRTIQISLEPGDDGYEEAPVNMTPALYQGDFKWIGESANSNVCGKLNWTELP